MRQSPREQDGARQTEEGRGDRSTVWGQSWEAAVCKAGRGPHKTRTSRLPGPGGIIAVGTRAVGLATAAWPTRTGAAQAKPTDVHLIRKFRHNFPNICWPHTKARVLRTLCMSPECAPEYQRRFPSPNWKPELKGVVESNEAARHSRPAPARPSGVPSPRTARSL